MSKNDGKDNGKGYDDSLLDEILGDDVFDGDDFTEELDDDLDKAINVSQKAVRIADEILLPSDVEDDIEKGHVMVVTEANTSNTGMSVEESIAVADMLTPQEMGRMLYTEVKRAGDLNNSLDVIEKILTDSNNERTLRLKSDEELRDLYSLLSAKQKGSQAFLIRILELGVKTKILKHLLGGSLGDEDPSVMGEGKKRVYIGQEASVKSAQISHLIRNEMDKRAGVQ